MAEERDVNEFRYSNYLEIGQNPFEFVLQFGQQYDDDGKKTLIHIRIVTSPAYAKHFAELLREAVDYYEEHHGTVPNA